MKTFIQFLEDNGWPADHIFSNRPAPLGQSGNASVINSPTQAAPALVTPNVVPTDRNSLSTTRQRQQGDWRVSVEERLKAFKEKLDQIQQQLGWPVKRVA